jgi:predicted esterase
VSSSDSADVLLALGADPRRARAAVVLVHGRGASPEAIAGLTRRLPQGDIAYLAPGAPGGVWYPYRFLTPRAENEPALSRALARIAAVVAGLVADGVPHERIGLVGFSQGACLVLEHALHAPRRYGFVAGLSGAMIGPAGEARAPADLCGTPVLIACAEYDAHIPIEYVEATALRFRASGAAVTHLTFAGDHHGVFPEEVAWLQKHVAALARR